MIAVLAVAVLTRFRYSRALAPISVSSLVIASIFGIRPLVLAPGGRDNDFYGYDPTAGYTLAVVVGLVALTSVLAGYLVYWSVRRQSPGQFHPRD